MKIVMAVLSWLAIIAILYIGLLGWIFWDMTGERYKEENNQQVYAVERPVEPLQAIVEEPVPKIKDDEECALSEPQLDVIRFSYSYGLEYDFGYTLAAIALKESNAGRWKVNLQDPSGGLYHVTIDKVLQMNGWEDTTFNRNRAMQILIDDDIISAKIAVEELQMWKDHNSGVWLDTWASYNHGWGGPNTDRGKAYAQDIRQLIQKIQYCGWV